jgi:hypothetical protein
MELRHKPRTLALGSLTVGYHRLHKHSNTKVYERLCWELEIRELVISTEPSRFLAGQWAGIPGARH